MNHVSLNSVDGKKLELIARSSYLQETYSNHPRELGAMATNGAPHR
jgi:hypothetical protein